MKLLWHRRPESAFGWRYRPWNRLLRALQLEPLRLWKEGSRKRRIDKKEPQNSATAHPDCGR